MKQVSALVHSVNALGRAFEKMQRPFMTAANGAGIPDWWEDETEYWERWYALCAVGDRYHERAGRLAKECAPWFEASAFEWDPIDVRHPSGAMQCTVCKRVGEERAECTDERCALLFPSPEAAA